jgi:hypothetical protein
LGEPRAEGSEARIGGAGPAPAESAPARGARDARDARGSGSIRRAHFFIRPSAVDGEFVRAAASGPLLAVAGDAGGADDAAAAPAAPTGAASAILDDASFPLLSLHSLCERIEAALTTPTSTPLEPRGGCAIVAERATLAEVDWSDALPAMSRTAARDMRGDEEEGGEWRSGAVAAWRGAALRLAGAASARPAAGAEGARPAAGAAGARPAAGAEGGGDAAASVWEPLLRFEIQILLLPDEGGAAGGTAAALPPTAVPPAAEGGAPPPHEAPPPPSPPPPPCRALVVTSLLGCAREEGEARGFFARLLMHLENEVARTNRRWRRAARSGGAGGGGALPGAAAAEPVETA